MSPDAWYQKNKGTSILVPGGGKDNNGQCVQAWDSYIHDVYAHAYVYTPAAIDLWNNFTQLGLNKSFTQIPKGQPILVGDSIIYDSRVGAPQGHVDNCSRAGSLADFWAYDSNWGHVNDPVTGYPVLHEVHHNDALNNYIVGYLRYKGGYMGFDYNSIPTNAEKIRFYNAVLGREPTAADLANKVPWGKLNEDAMYEFKAKYFAAVNNPPGTTPYTGPQLYVKD